MRSCPQCAEPYADDMRFCPVHGTELGPPDAVPAWERTTEVNQVLKAPDTARNLAAAGLGGHVDTHPSGRLLEVPRVAGVTATAGARDTAPAGPAAVTTPATRPIPRRGFGLAAVVGLALVGLGAATVVGGWYVWRRAEAARVASAPAPAPPLEVGVGQPEPEAQADPVEPGPVVEPAAAPSAEPGPAATAPSAAAPEPQPKPPTATTPAAASGDAAPKAGSGGGEESAASGPDGDVIEPDRVPPARTPAARPAGPVRMGPAELDARARKRAEPKYPDKLRERGVRGTVVVDILVDTDGDVESARAVSGPQELQKHAEKAARKWKFSPSAQQISGTLRFTFQ